MSRGPLGPAQGKELEGLEGGRASGLWKRLNSVGRRVWRRGEKEGEFVEKEEIFIGEGLDGASESSLA